MNVLDKYLAAADKARLADWEEWKDTNPRTGRITYTKGGRSYQRRLGTAEAETGPAALHGRVYRGQPRAAVAARR